MRRITHSLFGLLAIAIAAVAFAQDAAPTTAPATIPAVANIPIGKVNVFTFGDWGVATINKQAAADQQAVSDAMSKYAHAARKPFDGALLLGDNFYMDLKGIDDPTIQIVFEQMYDAKTLAFPFYVALGNHDYQHGKDVIELGYAAAHPESRFKMPARWYRVNLPVGAEHPLVAAFMLDSDRDTLTKEQWAEQILWLDHELSTVPAGVWKVCCAHHPLFSNGGHGDNGVLQKEWGSLFQKYNVDFYLCGHDHDLQHLEIPNWRTSFVLTGGGGQKVTLLLRDKRGPMSKLVHGFAHIAFDENTATVRYVTAEGALLHQFTRDRESGKVTVQVEGGHDAATPNPLKAIEDLDTRLPATLPSK